MKLTAAQRDALQRASDNHFGQLRRPSTGNGLVLAGWRRKCRNLVTKGLFHQNAHGDYEITNAGRAALAISSPDRKAQEGS